MSNLASWSADKLGGPPQAIQSNERPTFWRDLIEFIVGYGLILATVWAQHRFQPVLYCFAFLWILCTSLVRHESWPTLGVGWKGLRESLWVIPAALLAVLLAAFISFRLHVLHRLHGHSPLYSHMGGYMVWAVMQQFILQSFFLTRLLRLTTQRAVAAICAASLFSIAHLPNPVLAPVTLAWGLIACFLFLRYRNIYTLGIAHGLLGLCVAITVPDALQHHMRVGSGYYTYHPPSLDTRQNPAPGNTPKLR